MLADKDQSTIMKLIAAYDESNLKLPEPNPLIPQDFSIKSTQIRTKNLEEPILLKKEKGLQIWLH